MFKPRKKPQNKRCKDGYPCKRSCISRKKECLGDEMGKYKYGQAKTYLLWLKLQEERLVVTNKKRQRVGLAPAKMDKTGYIVAERNFTGKKEVKPASPKVESKSAIATKSGINLTSEKLEELYSRNNWWAGTKKQIESRLQQGIYDIDKNGELYKVKDSKTGKPTETLSQKEPVTKPKYSQFEIDAFNEYQQLSSAAQKIKGKQGTVTIRPPVLPEYKIQGTNFGNGVWVVKHPDGYHVTHEKTGQSFLSSSFKYRTTANEFAQLLSAKNNNVGQMPPMDALSEAAKVHTYLMLKKKGVNPNPPADSSASPIESKSVIADQVSSDSKQPQFGTKEEKWEWLSKSLTMKSTQAEHDLWKSVLDGMSKEEKREYFAWRNEKTRKQTRSAAGKKAAQTRQRRQDTESSRVAELSATPEGIALMEAEKSFNQTVKGQAIVDSRNFDKRLEEKNRAIINHNARKAVDSPTSEQIAYDSQQPEKINIETGAGLTEGWRAKGFDKYLEASYDKRSTTYHDSHITGIPWSVSFVDQEPRIIVGAKLKGDRSYDKQRWIELYDSKGGSLRAHFPKGDREMSARARRLIKEIVSGKSQKLDLQEIEALIKEGHRKSSPVSTKPVATTKEPSPIEKSLIKLFQEKATTMSLEAFNYEVVAGLINRNRGGYKMLTDALGLPETIDITKLQNHLKSLPKPEKAPTPNDRVDRALEPLKELAKLRIDPEVAAPPPETKPVEEVRQVSNADLKAKFREALGSGTAIAESDLKQIMATAPELIEPYKNVLQGRKKSGGLTDAQLKQLDDLENLDNPKPAIAEPVTEKKTKGGYESLPDSKGFQEMKTALSLPDDKWKPSERESISDKTLKDAIAAAKRLSPQEVNYLLSPQQFPPSESYDPILKLKEIKGSIEYTSHLSLKEYKLLNAYKEVKKNLEWAKDRHEKAHTPERINERKRSYLDDGIDPFTTQKLEKAQSEWDQVKDDHDRLVNLNEQRKQSLMADYNKAIAEVRKSAKNSASSPSLETKPVAEVQSKSKNNGNGGESAIANKESIETTFQSLVSVPEKIKDKVESSLIDGMRSESSWNRTKERYKEYADAVKTGNIPKGYGDYYDQNAAIYDALIKGEKFVSKRRKAIDNGDYQTPLEAKLFLSKKIRNNKEFDYFDSQEYTTEYPKLFAVKGDYQLPPPLTGTIPSSEIKKFMRQGDQLLVKENTYGLGTNQISGTKIVDGGTLLKSNVKNVKTRYVGEYMGKPYERENNTPIADITHIIRDGKRYKVI